jgi:MFS family permease
MSRNRLGLLTALGVDNFGSGLFLPVALLYVTRVVGLPLGVAGTVVAAGTVAGLTVPAVAGRLMDRLGSLRVVVGAEILQLLGMIAYLAARGAGLVALAAVLLAAGQQLFYSSLFTLISEVTGDGPKDRPFAVAAVIRGASFSLGALAAGALLSLAGLAAYRITVIADAVSFAGCGLLLVLLVRLPRRYDRPSRSVAAGGGPLSDRRFLAVIVAAGLASLAGDLFLSGFAVYAVRELHARPWLPGAALAMCAALSGTGATAVLRVTCRLRRTTVMIFSAGLYAAGCGACAGALAVSPGWRTAELLAAALVFAVAGLLFQRVNALAEALAPTEVRGRYLAAFQYAFTIPGVIAPAVIALFSVAAWLPWLLVAVGAALAVAIWHWLARRLPGAVLRPVPGRASEGSRASAGV